MSATAPANTVHGFRPELIRKFVTSSPWGAVFNKYNTGIITHDRTDPTEIIKNIKEKIL